MRVPGPLAAPAAALGWAVLLVLVAPDLPSPVPALLGAVAGALAGRLVAGRPLALRATVAGVVPLAAAAVAGELLLVPVDLAALLAWAALAVAASAPHRAGVRRAALLAVVGVGVTASVTVADAWSVDEPAGTVVVAQDTHAFLLRQGARILRGDGRTAVADFLGSPDPTAAGHSYLWRMQTGARDADRRLKRTVMPDHFFNWWTHSGKGLVAGPSAATYAEQQFAVAVRAWRRGDRPTAMYHLGAATHLVDDACAPPHEFLLVPHHRAYEEWVLARQESLAVGSGGIYASDFRQHTGHGGPAWSSAHTRGWVDECAHRAAEFVLNTMQPPGVVPGDPNPPAGADDHFRETQRLTAGYLAFFFDTVGGP